MGAAACGLPDQGVEGAVAHAGQQLPVPGVPPARVHLSAPGVGIVLPGNARIVWHCVTTQSLFCVQAVRPAVNVPSVHAPVVMSQVPADCVWHVSKAGLPKVDRAAQRMILP
jgi:hypothetical protein